MQLLTFSSVILQSLLFLTSYISAKDNGADGNYLEQSTYLECMLENFDHVRLIMKLIYNGEVENLSQDRIDLSLSEKRNSFMIGVSSTFNMAQLKDFCKPSLKVHILKKRLEPLIAAASSSSFSKANRAEPFYSKYPTYNEIYLRMKSLSIRSSKIVSVVMEKMGESHEGREISILRISSDISKHKPVIWISGGQHAREWVSPISCLWFAEQLLSDVSLLEKYDFAIAPLLNPDGYQYSQQSSDTQNRYFRKNRNPAGHVDLNRNWPNKDWANQVKGGGSSNKESQIYRGASPASEPEVKAVINYIEKGDLRNKLVAGIDVHSYGQIIMHSPDPQKPNNILLTAAMTNQINTSGPKYQKYRGISADNFYPTAGCMDDWFKEALRIPGFTIELRDKGYWGFTLPPNQIQGTAEELYAAVKGLVRAL